jgi:cell division protein FtsW
LGVSKDKWTTLPVPHTDSIFCVIGGELGLWGGITVIVLMMLLALGAFHVARRASTRLGWYLAASTGMALALQGFINIGVATALLPVTGLTLPFISHGGSSILSCLLATGIILAVAAEGRREGEV